MAPEPGKRLIIAFFDSPIEADRAFRSVQEQAVRNGEQGRVGVLALDRRGSVDASRLGDPIAVDGPGVGAVLAAIAQVLMGTTPSRRGHLFGSGSDLSADDVVRYGVELEAGGTAIAVLERRRESEQAVVALAELGGKIEVRRLSGSALRRLIALPL